MLLFRFSASFLLRLAEPRFLGLLFQEPPRNTRRQGTGQASRLGRPPGANQPSRKIERRSRKVRPRGLTPRRLAQLAGADPRAVRHATPDPWVPEPALVLSDVVAGREPWTGMLLDPASRRPVPIGSLVRSAGPAPARHWLVWPAKWTIACSAR